MLKASSCVLRFFEPLDRFVEILRRRPDEMAAFIPEKAPLDAHSYRRVLLRSCIHNYKDTIQPHLESLNALDPLSLQEYEEELATLVTEVNPELNLDKVQIPSGAPARRHQGLKLDVTRDLDKRLMSRIIGQDAAVQAVSWALKKAAVGLRTPRRPWGSFFFVGSTGVGKTQLARLIAEEVFGSDEFLMRIDCSEYGLPHEVAKLTGAPPGYVGFEQGGTLTGAVTRLKSCVVLFDEVEKADPKLHNTLLQILEDGILTDSAGQKVSFEETLIILTGNVGVADLHARHQAPGFNRGGKDVLNALEVSSTIHEALRANFSPEFLNRLDEVVVFRELDRNDARLIARGMADDLAERAHTQGVETHITQTLVEAVAEKGFSPWNGAREIRRTVARLVETPLVEAMLRGTVAEGHSVILDWTQGATSLVTRKHS